MSKYNSEVEEYLNSIGTDNKTNRFSKKKFNDLLTALSNDLSCSVEQVKIKDGQIATIEEIMVTKEFRKWCRKLLEKAGIDKIESKRILTEDIKFDSMDGLYEFFSAAMYIYMEKGNRFDFISNTEFKGSLELKDKEESITTSDTFKPGPVKEFIGVYETTKPKHKSLSAKSSCPSYLKKKRLVSQK